MTLRSSRRCLKSCCGKKPRSQPARNPDRRNLEVTLETVMNRSQAPKGTSRKSRHPSTQIDDGHQSKHWKLHSSLETQIDDGRRLPAAAAAAAAAAAPAAGATMQPAAATSTESSAQTAKQHSRHRFLKTHWILRVSRSPESAPLARKSQKIVSRNRSI